MKKIVLAILLILPFASQALTRTSVLNGNWSDPNIWSPVGIPQLSDDTIIVATSVFLTGGNIYFGNSLFKVATSGSLGGGPTDTLTFGGDVMEIRGYTSLGVLIVGANDSVVNYNQIEVAELTQSGLMINNGLGICITSQLITSDVFINNTSVSCNGWVNSGIVSGNQGRFCIAQDFINTDQISGNIDICDATPGGMGDVNMGTISGSVTSCAVGSCWDCLQPGFNEDIINVGISIVPHPVSTVSLIVLETELLRVNTQSVFILSDVQGRTIKEISFTGNQLSFDRTGMESGLYFYSVILSDGSVASGKLLVD